jgi:hypothetical protein
MQFRHHVDSLGLWIAPAALLSILGLQVTPVRADDASAAAGVPQRPSIMFNRWQEDWSVLADPRVPREPLDSLKYIPLSSSDPKTCLSFGAGVRERFEALDAARFGIAPSRNNDYLISRVETHADLRIGSEVQMFAQFLSAFAPGKTMIAPVDRDRLDLEQAFIAVVEPVSGGTLKLRFGRQQFAFDLQRFVSVRDGPNIRQSYDAAWGDYELGPWRVISFYSQPVQNRDLRVFDDYSSGHLTYGGVRLERQFGPASLTAYYSRFTQDGARFLTVNGNERRDILDVRFGGATKGFDWDIEAMGQAGEIGGESIAAWAVGSLAGYTFADLPWKPRVGLQIDAASGDDNPTDHHLGTFNPLFPNGYYFTLAGFTGYVNLIHVKPSATIHPTESLKVMAAVAGQWRETTADAVYVQPNIPLPGTAGRPGQYTGTYEQLRADWAITPHYAAAVEAVHFSVGRAIRRAGGRDGNYVGVELKFGW